MRQMTLDEQRKVLHAITHAHFGAGMMYADAICYGGDAKGYRQQEEFCAEVILAFPEDIREAYNAELRKQEADKLRAKADKVERGEKVDG